MYRTAIIAVTILFLVLGQAFAQEQYPNRAIRIIAPTVAGAGNDIIARLVAQGLFERPGRQVIVENRIGAGTIIGTKIVAKAPPDGYTLLSANSAFAINPSVYKKMPYDAIRDFAPITISVCSKSNGCTSIATCEDCNRLNCALQSTAWRSLIRLCGTWDESPFIGGVICEYDTGTHDACSV